MAINLNHEQYRQFATFAANARSDTAIVQLGKAERSHPPGAQG